jgi:hypothetical protein
MTFKATIREINNGFLVEHSGSKLFDYSETHVPTLDTAIELVIAKYAEGHPRVTPATPLKVPEKAPKRPLLKEPSEAALKYTKICGLIAKPLGDFQEQFFKSFPGENPTLAVIQAKCKVVGDTEKYVVFVGG